MTGNINRGGPEWKKWCADEGPLKIFRKTQRALRQERIEKQINKDMKTREDDV